MVSSFLFLEQGEQLPHFLCFDDELEAEVVFDFRMSARRDGEDFEALGEFSNQPAAQGCCPFLYPARFFTPEGELDKVCEGGIGKELPHCNFLVEKALVILLFCEFDHGVVLHPGLDDDLAAQSTAARSSGDLGEELEDCFTGPEIGDLQAAVGIEDPDEGHLGEVEPFGDHLRADQDVCFAGPKAFKKQLVASLVARCVGV